MFSSIYDTFLYLLTYLEPVWTTLMTPITEMPIFTGDTSSDWWWDVLFPWANFIPSLTEVLTNYFGDITLLQAILGGSVSVFIFAYVYKFFKGFVI